MIRSNKLRFIFSIFLIIFPAGYFYYQNNSIESTYYSIASDQLSKNFDEYRIIQISDLHNKDFGSNLKVLVANEDPDIIVVTGDIIDRNRTNVSVALEAFEWMLEIAPVYFVTGNHEYASGVYDDFRASMLELGVIDFDNSSEIIEIEGNRIGLVGIEDPLFLTRDDIEEAGNYDLAILGPLNQLVEELNADYTILLSHRAELLYLYAQANIDLAITGHAHGGQIRLPFLEGLFAPGQGFLPKYTAGVYEKEDTLMVVSRGLGNSVFPIRVNNRPELVVISLHPE